MILWIEAEDTLNRLDKVLEELTGLFGSNMSRSTLANIETGRRNIKATDLKLLKRVLDVSYDFFAE